MSAEKIDMSKIHYLTDAEGSPIAVQIPITDWQVFQKEIKELKRKLEILQGIKAALQEAQQFKKGKRQLQTLTEFLNEC